MFSGSSRVRQLGALARQGLDKLARNVRCFSLGAGVSGNVSDSVEAIEGPGGNEHETIEYGMAMYHGTPHGDPLSCGGNPLRTGGDRCG